MGSKGNAICIWSGPAALMIFFAAILTAGFLPPTSPLLNPAEIGDLYVTHLTRIRIGAILFTISPGLILAFIAAISAQIKRIEGPVSPLAYAQLATGTFGTMPFLVTPLLWTAATFRLDRAPEITQALNDFGWIFLVMPAPPVTIQLIVIGIAILQDRGPQPVFPRWAAFLNFWVAILLMPGLLISFFKTGPFAWNGLLAFWLPAVVFGSWVMGMTIVLLRANKQAA
jgi:hypothetical protein